MHNNSSSVLAQAREHHPTGRKSLQKRSDAIQILRAAAAILVVFAHSFDLTQQFGIPRQSHFFYLENFGACGVDIFFAISGYILSSVLLRRDDGSSEHAGKFLLRRYVRILPIYWIITSIKIPATLRQGDTTAHIISSYLLLPELKYPMSNPIVMLGWTLMFEMFFYYVLAANIKISRKLIVVRTIATVLFLVVVGLLVGVKHPILVLIANPINVEFALGCCIGLFGERIRGTSWRAAHTLMISGTVLLLWTMFTGYGHADDNLLVLAGEAWYRLFRWGLPAAMLVAGASLLRDSMVTRVGRFWVYLGDASYSIYLTSILSFSWLARLYTRIHPAVPDLLIYLNVAAVVLLGVAFYRFVEAPITRNLTRYLKVRAIQSAP